MASLNKIILLGNLTRDIELKALPGGTTVGTFGMAINHRYKSKDGEQKEEVMFIDCEVWGKAAETLNRFVAKGFPLFVDGRLKLDQWKDKDGSNRQRHKVVVERFELIKRGNGQSDESDAAPTGGAAATSQATKPAPVKSGPKSSAPAKPGWAEQHHEPLTEDDIPF